MLPWGQKHLHTNEHNFLFVPYANSGKEMLNEHESVFMYVWGAVLGSSSWAACERCTRRPTEHFKKQKERESELSGQGRRWAELIPEETRFLEENFITVTFPSATHTWTQQEGRLFVLPSHLEYNYRRQLCGGAVEVNGANPRVEDVVSNRFIKKKKKKKKNI